MPTNNEQPDRKLDEGTEAAERPMFAVCVDHVERALEEYVDEHLRAPDIFLVDDPAAAEAMGGRPIPQTCRFCDERAKYLII